MKIRRFLSVFILLTLVMSQWALPHAAAMEDPAIAAKAALLANADTGEIAYAHNEHDELYPASLTKVMTALLVLEAVNAGTLTMDTMLTASASALTGLSADGSSANLKVGETMSVRNLLYCMLVVSANEACDILAEGVSGSVEAFVAAMNAKAEALGCANTHFVNPNGLHDPQHYTSAWDLYLITTAAMKYPDFMVFCDTANVVIPATNLSDERTLWTTNHLLSNWRVVGYRNKDAHGIKTGSTDAAGHCLISSASRGSLHFISVVMGAERVEENGVGNILSFSETTRLFNWGFQNFHYASILESKEPIGEVKVSLSKTDYVTVHPSRDVEALVPKDLTADTLERIVTVESPVNAPVAEGQELGTLELRYDGRVYASVPLVAANDVEADRMMVLLQNGKDFFSKPAVLIIAGALAALLLVLVLLLFLRSGRRRYGSGSTRSYRSGYRGRRR